MTYQFNTQNFPFLEKGSEIPRLPLPPLEETLKRYLRCVEALVPPEQFEQTKKNVADFAQNAGPILDQDLRRIEQATPTSWLEGFWDSAYLDGRDPIAININPGFVFRDVPNATQASRASHLLFASADFFLQVKTNKLPHDKVKTTPLCMSQYSRVLASTHLPAVGRDFVQTYPNSRHVAVLHRGHFFAFDVLDQQGNILDQADMQRNFQEIIKAVGGRNNPHPVGVFTAENRDTWAQVRARLLANKDNSEALSAIEQALCVVNLDFESPTTFESASKLALHADGTNRWFDKSIQLIVWANGRSGINMEHAAFDGHTFTRYADFIHKGSQVKGVSFPSPVRQLRFTLTKDLIQDLETAKKNFNSFVAITQTSVLIMPNLGKGEIVKLKISPDAFIQMAFQLAFSRLYKKPGSTYESAQTKKFYHGRTECIRSPTLASNAFVRAFNSSVPAAEKAAALYKAASVHSQNSAQYNDAQGFERHLLALQYLAKHRRQYFPGFQIPALYTDPTYATLKTDLMSTSNCGSENLTIFTFGPVCEFGLGLGYFINKDAIHVNITSFKGEAHQYNKLLKEAILEMKQILEQNVPMPPSKL